MGQLDTQTSSLRRSRCFTLIMRKYIIQSFRMEQFKPGNWKRCLQIVFKDGVLLVDNTLEDIRNRVISTSQEPLSELCGISEHISE